MNKLFFLFIIGVVFSTNAKQVSVPLASNGDGEIVVIASIQQTDNYSGQGLLTKKAPSKELQALQQYYRFAKADNTKQLLTTLFEGDGTRANISKELKRRPDKFSNYNKLSALELNNNYLWGEYAVLSLDWGINGKAMSWYDAVYCSQQRRCAVSDMMVRGSDNSGMVSSVIALAEHKPHFKSTKSFDFTVDYFPDYGVNKVNPVTVKFDLTPLASKVTFSKGSSAEVNVNKDKGLANINKYIQAVWQHSKDTTEFWRNYDPQVLIPVMYGEQDMSIKYYTATAYMQFIGNISEIKFVTTLKTKETIYYIAKVKHAEFSNYMLFAVDKKSHKLKHSYDEPLFSSVLTSREFYNKLNATQF